MSMLSDTASDGIEGRPPKPGGVPKPVENL
jgi:hypothetical protein